MYQSGWTSNDGALHGDGYNLMKFTTLFKHHELRRPPKQLVQIIGLKDELEDISDGSRSA